MTKAMLTLKKLNLVYFSVDNFRPVQKLGERKVLDVMTVEMLRKGSHTAPSFTDRISGSGALLIFLVVAVIKAVLL